LLVDNDDSNGVATADGSEGDVQLPRVARVPFGRGVAALLQRSGYLPSALSRAARPDGPARVGLALLITWAICSGLLAFFADDPEGTPQHGSGIVHLVLAFIAFSCIAVGAILISASLMPDPAWRPAAPVLLAISIAAAIAYVLLGLTQKNHHAPHGLYERVFLGLELAWIAVAAIVIARRTRAAQPE
jgi:hypothetical protein